MTRIRLIAGSIAALATFVAAGVAMAQIAAQTAAPTRLRGSISAIDGKTAAIATREGASVKVNLADNWVAVLVVPIALSEVKANSFVGIASLKGADGVQNALEVLVFPEAARGSNEGHYPWDLQPQSMMTNATVATVAAAGDGQTLTLKYKDGTQNIRVKPGIPIVTFAPGDRVDAKVGAKVFLVPAKGADGTLTATRILVGKDGLTPPM